MQHPEATATPADLAYVRDHVVLVVMAKNEGPRLDRLLKSTRAQGVTKEVIYDGTHVWVPGQPELSRGFGVERRAALDTARAAYPRATWALLLDADMRLMGNLAELCTWVREAGECDNVHLVQKDAEYEYDNVRLVRLAPARECLGRTHEHWAGLGTSITDHNKLCWILDHCDGANRDVKLARDEALLRLDLADAPNSERAVFYLAQTLDGLGKLEEAIELYTRRVGMGGFEQEAWIARLRAGQCYLRAAGYTKGIGILLDAWARKPWRAEPLYQIALAMVGVSQHRGAMALADLIDTCKEQPGDLFSEPHVYGRGANDIRATSAYHVQEPDRGMQACEQLMRDPTTDKGRVLERMSWYLQKLTTDRQPQRLSVLSLFLEQGRFVATNPCVTEYGTNIRLVNYHQQNGRHYEARDADKKIRTQNVFQRPTENRGRISLVTVQESWTYTLPGAETHHEIQGLEDVRFHRELLEDNLACFTATCCECPGEEGNPQVVIGMLDLVSMHARVVPIKYAAKQKYEKNWVILDRTGMSGYPTQVKILYSINPTVVLTVDADNGEVLETKITPGPLETAGLFRNSTPPVPVRGQYVMLAHDVGRRADLNVYMHRWVWLDSSWQVIGTSEPFTIKHTGVEYACGLARAPGRPGFLRISFGVNDREAWTLDVEEPELFR